MEIYQHVLTLTAQIYTFKFLRARTNVPSFIACQFAKGTSFSPNAEDLLTQSMRLRTVLQKEDANNRKTIVSRFLLPSRPKMGQALIGQALTLALSWGLNLVPSAFVNGRWMAMAAVAKLSNWYFSSRMINYKLLEINYSRILNILKKIRKRSLFKSKFASTMPKY